MEDNEKTFPDDTLVTMFRGGDNHAFEVLLARYTGDIKRSIKKSTMSNCDTADDLYQEIVVHLCEKLKGMYQANGHFAAWLNCVVGKCVSQEASRNSAVEAGCTERHRCSRGNPYSRKERTEVHRSAMCRWRATSRPVRAGPDENMGRSDLSGNFRPHGY